MGLERSVSFTTSDAPEGAGRAALAEFDADLRDAQNSRNPGTTADLTAAAIFSALVEDGVVKTLHIEAPGKFEVSKAEVILGDLK